MELASVVKSKDQLSTVQQAIARADARAAAAAADDEEEGVKSAEAQAVVRSAIAKSAPPLEMPRAASPARQARPAAAEQEQQQLSPSNQQQLSPSNQQQRQEQQKAPQQPRQSPARSAIASTSPEVPVSPGGALAKAKPGPRPRVQTDAMITTMQAPAPKNSDEWLRATQANMFRVESLTANVFAKVNENKAAEEGARKAMQDYAKHEREKQRIKVHAKVKVHQEFIGLAMKCMKEIEYAIVQVEGAQGRLTAERYARFAETKVCENRLQLRAKRPPQELFRDEVQRQLEKQVENLNTARQDLLKQEQEAKRYVLELKQKFETLAKDIGNRRFAMRIDLGTIAAGEELDLHVTEDISDKRSKQIEARAYEVAAAGLVLSAYSVELVKSIKTKSAEIDKQVMLSLKLHTKELAVMKSSLARKVIESETAIDKAGTQLRHMEERVKQGDPAMAELVSTMKALLRDLNATRSKTIEDVRSKTAALDIDNSCRKVTPAMAADPVAAKMAASASAPSLGTPKMSSSGKAKPSMSGEFSIAGNPQQGDYQQLDVTLRQSKSSSKLNAHNRPSPSSSAAGGSSSLKATASTLLQGHPQPRNVP